MSEHELWNELGNLYFMSGAYPEAAEAYHRSIRLDKGFGRPYSNLALTYVQQGKYGKAIELYRRSIELLAENKEKAISWNRLGNAYRFLKDYQHAVVAYRMADGLDPESTEGRDQPGRFSNPVLETMPAGAQPIAETPKTTATEETRQAVEANDLRVGEETSHADVFEAAWSQANVSAYPQDLSLSTDPGSVIAWDDPEFDKNDLSPYDMPADPEMEVDVPDPDGDDLSRWLPFPEDEPQHMIQLGSGWAHSSSDVEAEQEDIAEAEETADDAQEDGKTTGDNQVADEFQTAAMEMQTPADSARTDLIVSPSTSQDVLLLPSGAEPAPANKRQEPATQQMGVSVGIEERPVSQFVVNRDDKSVSTVEGVQPQDDAERPHDVAGDTEPGSGTTVGDSDPEREAQEMQEIEAGIEKFKRVVEINTRNAHAWDALGSLYKSAGRYKEALVAYEQAIANDPSRASYHHHLGLVYACEGRTEDAISAYQRVIEIDPSHSLAHAALGGYYRKLGFEELAQKHVGKAMKSIFDSENEYNRACLAAICGNTDQALELLRVALTNKQTYVDWILRDPDLDFIRHDPRFKQLISDYTR